MKRAHLILAVITGLLSLAYLGQGLTYPLGTLARPGPGIFPLFIGIMIFLGSLSTALGAMRKDTLPEEVQWPDKRGFWRIAAVTIVTLAYVIGLSNLGQIVSSVVVTFVVLHVMGMRSWVLKIGLALMIGFSTYYLFAKLLGVPLPQGIISFL